MTWYGLIPLNRRGEVVAFATVDAEDFERFRGRRWRLTANGYAINASGRVLMHREILGLERGDKRQGDHRNRRRLDNRRANLRSVPLWGNRQNVTKLKGCTSRYRGVSWSKHAQRWTVRVWAGGRARNLGYFTDEREAAEVAERARRETMRYAEPDPALSYAGSAWA